MPRARVKAVCGSCKWRSNCSDAATLERLRRFLENSRLAAELALTHGKRYRLGCERYQPDRREKLPSQPPLRIIVANDRSTPCA